MQMELLSIRCAKTCSLIRHFAWTAQIERQRISQKIDSKNEQMNNFIKLTQNDKTIIPMSIFIFSLSISNRTSALDSNKFWTDRTMGYFFQYFCFALFRQGPVDGTEHLIYIQSKCSALCLHINTEAPFQWSRTMHFILCVPCTAMYWLHDTYTADVTSNHW